MMKWVIGLACVACLFIVLFTTVSTSMTPQQVLPMETDPITPASPKDTWQEFASAQGKFRIMLPALPQNATETVIDAKTKQTRKYDMFVAQAIDGKVFMISLITFPLENASENPIPDIMNDMVASSQNNVLKNVKETQYQDLPATDFEIENDKMKIYNRAFKRDQTLYLLSAVVQNGANLDPDAFLFMNSFELEK